MLDIAHDGPNFERAPHTYQAQEDRARETLERLLIEHEDYVMLDRVRDQLAELREPEDEVQEGEVP